jgi:Flp pilus assembly protein TadB
MNAKTTDTDRLDYLRLFKGALEAHRAQGDDIDDVIRRLDRVIAKREKEMHG